jgi:hypothetical protein
MKIIDFFVKEEQRISNLGHDPVTLVDRRIGRTFLPVRLPKDTIEKIIIFGVIFSLLKNLPNYMETLEIWFGFFKALKKIIL